MMRPPDEAAQAEAAALEIWNDLLRGYAEAVEQQRAYLLTSGSLDDVDEAMLVPPSFQIPAEVPPMPASLEPWALSLLTETAGLTEIAHQILSDRPASSRPMRFAAAASGSVLDQKI